MTTKVVVDIPSMAKGELVEVLYLGMFENGGTHDLTEAQVAQYEASSQRTFPKSGYLFAGDPKGDVQTKAFEANQKEGTVSTRPTELVATQVDAQNVNPQTANVEGSTTEEEGK